MANQSARTYKYMSNFSCIGADCEDSCCSGWNVTVDKSTFKKLKNSSNPEVVSGVKKYFKIQTEATNSYFASIQLDNKGHCPMLDSESMCSIQRKLDHSYLPRTCADFPRYYHRVADKSEVVGTLACPELARKEDAARNPAQRGHRPCRSASFGGLAARYRRISRQVDLQNGRS